MSIPILLFLLLLPASATNVYFLPSFQGTLLHHKNKPLHLSPLTPTTYNKTYTLLTHLLTTSSTYTDYPTTICTSSSHVGHCTPLPATGPIASLRKKYNLTIIPYDWRLSSHVLRPFVNFPITRIPHPSILLAHGTACRLATILAPRNLTLVCLSPLPATLAQEALTTGEGLLTMGHAHHYHHPAHTHTPLQFGIMEHQLGLVSRRVLLPVTHGPWDPTHSFAAPQHARLRLASQLDSVKEFARGGVLGLGDASICVQGTGVGHACDGFLGRVVTVNNSFFDVVGLVDAALNEIGPI